jgi:hypothetical protein
VDLANHVNVTTPDPNLVYATSIPDNVRVKKMLPDVDVIGVHLDFMDLVLMDVYVSIFRYILDHFSKRVLAGEGVERSQFSPRIQKKGAAARAPRGISGFEKIKMKSLTR